MPRPKKPKPRPVPPIAVIAPHAVLDAEQLRVALSLAPGTIRLAVREQGLRVTRRAGRYYFLGSWVLRWLRAGEVTRKPKIHGASSAAGGSSPH